MEKEKITKESVDLNLTFKVTDYKDYKENPGRLWHDKVQGAYEIKGTIKEESSEKVEFYIWFRLSRIFSGCGSLNLHSVSINNLGVFDNYPELVSIVSDYIQTNIIEKVRKNGVGAIITTLGQYSGGYNVFYYDILKMEKLIAYTNYRHGPNYKQGLLIKTL